MSELGFDDFVLDVGTGELRKNGRTQKLHPQPAQLLELLVGRGGEIVSRQEIQDAL
jgi:DNA-binding winged helix-turn-helix (wHTH) protein